MKPLRILDPLAEIRRLYFETTRATIDRDFERAVALLKSMDGEEQRSRATVFMQGLAEMRKEWEGRRGKGTRKGKGKREQAKGHL